MPNRNNIYPCCALCGQIPPGGLHDGLHMLGSFICSECEAELISLDENDPRYAHYVALLQNAFKGRMHQAIVRYTPL